MFNFPSWQKRSGHNRAQITYFIAENMELRKEEFIKTLVESCGSSREDAAKEVDETVHRLFHWAAYADKYGGNVQVMITMLLKQFPDL